MGSKRYGVATALAVSLAVGGGPVEAQDLSAIAPRKAASHRTGKPARPAHQRAAETAPGRPAGTTIPMDLTDMNRGVSGYGDPRTRPAAGSSDDPDAVRPTLGTGLTPGAAFAF